MWQTNGIIVASIKRQCSLSSSSSWQLENGYILRIVCLICALIHFDAEVFILYYVISGDEVHTRRDDCHFIHLLRQINVYTMKAITFASFSIYHFLSKLYSFELGKKIISKIFRTSCFYAKFFIVVISKLQFSSKKYSILSKQKPILLKFESIFKKWRCTAGVSCGSF